MDRRATAYARPACLALALALAMALGACAPYIKDFETAAPHTTNVELVQVTHDIAFKSDQQYISDASGKELDDFLATMRLSREDHVLVVDRDGTSPWAGQRAESVRLHLASQQVASDAGRPAAEVPAKRDTVTVVLERVIFKPLDCPDWTEPEGSNPENNLYRNFGCAEANNLREMVADRRDLLTGRPNSQAEAGLAAVNVRYYRADNQKPLEVSAISPVGSATQQQQQRQGSGGTGGQ